MAEFSSARRWESRTERPDSGIHGTHGWGKIISPSSGSSKDRHADIKSGLQFPVKVVALMLLAAGVSSVRIPGGNNPSPAEEHCAFENAFLERRFSDGSSIAERVWFLPAIKGERVMPEDASFVTSRGKRDGDIMPLTSLLSDVVAV